MWLRSYNWGCSLSGLVVICGHSPGSVWVLQKALWASKLWNRRDHHPCIFQGFKGVANCCRSPWCTVFFGMYCSRPRSRQFQSLPLGIPHYKSFHPRSQGINVEIVITTKNAVLVCWGCHSQCHRPGGWKNRICFLTVLGTSSLRSRSQQGCFFWGLSPWPAGSHHLLSPCVCLCLSLLFF